MTVDEYLNTIEAAKVLGFHRMTMERICREDRLPAKKIHNKWRIDKSEVEKYLADSITKNERIREFERKLVSARKQLGLSQSQLAVILGVSSAAISRWEHGNRSPWAKHSKQILCWLQHIDQ